MDLSGIGIELFPGAFSFVVPDDALRSLEICRGDIAIVQPFDGDLEEGQFLVVSAGLEDKIGRVKREGRTWCLETTFGPNREPMVMYEHPIKGKVIGFLRLFIPTKPVYYRPDDAHFVLPTERPHVAQQHVASKAQRKGAVRAKGAYRQKARSKTQWLTAEETGEKPSLTEVEDSNPYGAPTKSCFR